MVERPFPEFSNSEVNAASAYRRFEHVSYDCMQHTCDARDIQARPGFVTCHHLSFLRAVLCIHVKVMTEVRESDPFFRSAQNPTNPRYRLVVPFQLGCSGERLSA